MSFVDARVIIHSTTLVIKMGRFATLLLLAAVPIAFALDTAAARSRFLVNNATHGAITMNGIWYSQSNSTTDVNAMDSLKDAKACTRDAALMAQLGINTIYVMAIDPKENHDECFSIFNSVGIYIMVALRRDGLFRMTYEDFANSYTTDRLKGFFEVVDAVKDYDNLLGFDLGLLPSILEFVEPGKSLTYADTEKLYRAFIRDMKEYISKHASRSILVGATLHLDRADEMIVASELSQAHVEWFSCAVGGKKDDFSRADYVSFFHLGYWEIEPVEKQVFTYASLAKQLAGTNAPTWLQMYGVSDEADYVEYELRPDLVQDSFLLYNSSSQIIQPNGPLTGGARFTWTNTNIGWKQPISNWGITITAPNGDIQLTPNFEALRDIFSSLKTGPWLNGYAIDASLPGPSECRASALKNTTLKAYGDNVSAGPMTITIATDWALPTRPPGLDALVTSGVKGKTGRMVDVTVTTVAYAVRDSKGAVVADLVLKPSKSQALGTASASSSSSGVSASAGANMGVGMGVGIAGVVGVAGMFL